MVPIVYALLRRLFRRLWINYIFSHGSAQNSALVALNNNVLKTFTKHLYIPANKVCKGVYRRHIVGRRSPSSAVGFSTYNIASMFVVQTIFKYFMRLEITFSNLQSRCAQPVLRAR